MQQAQDTPRVTEAKGIIAALANESTACYTDRKPKFRILCGSILIIVGRLRSRGKDGKVEQEQIAARRSSVHDDRSSTEYRL